jgi:hypothetical protein
MQGTLAYNEVHTSQDYFFPAQSGRMTHLPLKTNGKNVFATVRSETV